MSRSRKVLMISCAFPPTGGPGVQRSAKFAKYLPAFGWRPIVWCAGPLAALPRDDSLLTDLPGEVAIHTHAYQPDSRPGGLLAGLTRRAAARIGWSRANRTSEVPYPDEFITWADSSVEPLLALIGREDVAAIYSTFSPASNHCLATSLKARTGLPWLADFRDLWTDDYRYPKTTPERSEADRQLESRFLTTADVIIGVTPSQTQILAGDQGGSTEKFETITNGFDAEDFAAPEATRRTGEPFVLAHVGRLDQYRSYGALFEGLQQFVEKLGAGRDRFLFRIVGHAGDAARAQLLNTAVRCEFTGYVSHGDAIREMRAADALLLTVPTGPNAASVIPAKLFEYLAAQRPILTVAPTGSECERIVNETRSGLTAGIEAGQIAAALHRMYSASSEGRPMPGCPTNNLAPYERKTLTGRLADLLDHVLAAPGTAAQESRILKDEEMLCSR